MTSQSKKYPTRIEIKHNRNTGWIVIDHISTIDKQRIFKSIGNLSDSEIEKVKMTIKELLVD
jgi:mRNA interferase MazF